MMPGVKQHVPIDRISGLIDGQVYRLQFFHSRRQADRANFRMRTNLDIVGSSNMAVTPVGD
jgi:fibro-slime domain-containing protein